MPREQHAASTAMPQRCNTIKLHRHGMQAGRMPERFAIEKGRTRGGSTAPPGQNWAEKPRVVRETTGRMVGNAKRFKLKILQDRDCTGTAGLRSVFAWRCLLAARATGYKTCCCLENAAAERQRGRKRCPCLDAGRALPCRRGCQIGRCRPDTAPDLTFPE